MMAVSTVKMLAWNANGLVPRWQELNHFLSANDIDIALISETHLISREQTRKFYGYSFYCCNHPSNNARGGSLVMVKNSIEHHDRGMYVTNGIQASVVTVKLRNSQVNIGGLYCPPGIALRQEDFEDLFATLGDRWIIGGDLNAKHPSWGSRITTPRGRSLHNAICKYKCSTISPNMPTHYPADPNKRPDIIDFFIARNFSTNYIDIECLVDLSSDHLPLVLTINSNISKVKVVPRLTNKSTNWSTYREVSDNQFLMHAKIVTAHQLDDAVKKFTGTIVEAASKSTVFADKVPQTTFYPGKIKQLVKQRRRARWKWIRTRNPADKSVFNRMARLVKEALTELNNESFQQYLTALSPSKDGDYSLWKASRRITKTTTTSIPLKNEAGEMVSDNLNKANLFASSLEEVFKPNDIKTDVVPYVTLGGLDVIKHASPIEVAEVLDKLKVKKTPGPDRVNADMLKNLSKKGIVYLTKLINTALRLKYVPKEWKLADVIMILKPGKPPDAVSSYRPISLLSIISKVFERILLPRIKIHVDNQDILPEEQFGFRAKHGTIEQAHRLANHISQALENKQYCPTVFLDVARAFDRVWHEGLTYKLSKILPSAYCELIQSYLSERFFRVKIGADYSDYRPIQAGVPQGSVLGPTLYILYTHDIPRDAGTTLAVFADDTAISANHANYVNAVNQLQHSLNSIGTWARRWKISVNDNKSIRVDFALRHHGYSPSTWENRPIPLANAARYLGLHLDSKLNWAEHVRQKRTALNLKLRKFYWLLGRHSKLSLSSKRLIYQMIFKPVWTYGIPLWGTTKPSNREIIQRFQNKVLRVITDAPWYISNKQLHEDLALDTVEETYRRHVDQYIKRLHNHPNTAAIQLLDTTMQTHRLQRSHILDT